MRKGVLVSDLGFLKHVEGFLGHYAAHSGLQDAPGELGALGAPADDEPVWIQDSTLGSRAHPSRDLLWRGAPTPRATYWATVTHNLGPSITGRQPAPHEILLDRAGARVRMIATLSTDPRQLTHAAPRFSLAQDPVLEDNLLCLGLYLLKSWAEGQVFCPSPSSGGGPRYRLDPDFDPELVLGALDPAAALRLQYSTEVVSRLRQELIHLSRELGLPYLRSQDPQALRLLLAQPRRGGDGDLAQLLQAAGFPLSPSPGQLQAYIRYSLFSQVLAGDLYPHSRSS